MNCQIVGISGGSCSGKTTLAQELYGFIGKEKSLILLQDNYYFDQSQSFDGDGESVNFDHPSAIEFSLLRKHLRSLKEGCSIDVPIYDFKTHQRSRGVIQTSPKEWVILDGTLILTQPSIVDLLDFSVFIQCDYSTRFSRRLERDVQERGRTELGVKKQFDKQVEPMHQAFVEPSQGFATRVLNQEEFMSHGLELVLRLLNLNQCIE